MGGAMKRSRKFSYNFLSDKPDRTTDFYSFDFFDHDLILFCDSGLGYRFKYEELTVIGGRSAFPLESDKLCEVLPLSKEDRSFLVDFLDDGNRKFCLLNSKNKVVLVFNQLFRSCGLGVAAVLNYSPEYAASAIKRGLLDRIGYRAFSPSIVEKARETVSDEEENMDLVYSALKLADLITAMLGDGTRSLSSRIGLVSDLIGCGRMNITAEESEADAKLDLDSLVAILLCLLSLCRRLSVSRGGELSIDGTASCAKISLGFDTIDKKASDSELACISFCERLALKLEMPLSIELSDGRFFSEFVPFRVDPSLYGLKAGVRLSVKSAE